jgi:hypothetical protein
MDTDGGEEPPPGGVPPCASTGSSPLLLSPASYHTEPCSRPTPPSESRCARAGRLAGSPWCPAAARRRPAAPAGAAPCANPSRGHRSARAPICWPWPPSPRQTSPIGASVSNRAPGVEPGRVQRVMAHDLGQAVQQRARRHAVAEAVPQVVGAQVGDPRRPGVLLHQLPQRPQRQTKRGAVRREQPALLGRQHF